MQTETALQTEFVLEVGLAVDNRDGSLGGAGVSAERTVQRPKAAIEAAFGMEGDRFTVRDRFDQ